MLSRPNRFIIFVADAGLVSQGATLSRTEHQVLAQLGR